MLANSLIQRILRPPSSGGAGPNPGRFDYAQVLLFFGIFEGSLPKKAAFVEFL
jgi:hypothetical protein